MSQRSIVPFLTNIPIELIQRILSYLRSIDIAMLALTQRKLYFKLQNHLSQIHYVYTNTNYMKPEIMINEIIYFGIDQNHKRITWSKQKNHNSVIKVCFSPCYEKHTTTILNDDYEVSVHKHIVWMFDTIISNYTWRTFYQINIGEHELEVRRDQGVFDFIELGEIISSC